MNEEKVVGPGAEKPEDEAPPFEPPRVLSFRGDEIQQLLGPVQACSYAGPTIGCGVQQRGMPYFRPDKGTGSNW